MDGSLDLSIIIPAFNEEKRIGFTLQKIVDLLAERPWRWEIIVVDDGSGDGTVRCVEQFAARLGEPAFPERQITCLHNGRNRGKGYSIRHGVGQARGRCVGFMDADYKTEVKALDAVFEMLDRGYDGVLGDRTLGCSQIAVARRRYRQLGSRVFGGLLRWCMGMREFGDTQCGFKFFQRAVAAELFTRQRTDGFMFDVEIVMLAIRSGYCLARIPVVWSDDPDSRFKPFTGSLRNLKELICIYWRHCR